MHLSLLEISYNVIFVSISLYDYYYFFNYDFIARGRPPTTSTSETATATHYNLFGVKIGEIILLSKFVSSVENSSPSPSLSQFNSESFIGMTKTYILYCQSITPLPLSLSLSPSLSPSLYPSLSLPSLSLSLSVDV